MTPPIPRLTLPKPSRCVGWTRARTSSPGISRDDAAAVLEGYAIDQRRRPSNLSMSWRNETVVLHTTSGPKVLKRYRATANVAAVIHEHSIIDRLVETGIDAIRLEHLISGASFVERNGRVHALFEFANGRHFASRFLSKRQRAGLIERSGATLARFHDEMVDFEPSGAHHLGLDPTSGQSKNSLEWYLQALDRLQSVPSGSVDAEADQATEWLRSRSGYIADSLRTFASEVETAALPHTVIHGDYGIHNLLFRSDGAVVMHDFELARREWRLLDFVLATGRLRPENQRIFMKAYRRHSELTPQEVAMMPTMWSYRLLTGAIRSWNGYVEHGGLQRLATARSRVEQFTQGPDEVLLTASQC